SAKANGLERTGEGLAGDPTGAATYCGPASEDLAYPHWSSPLPNLWKRIIRASAFAIFAQWGTTEAAVLSAYKTPTVGLGCRAGAYLLYGVLGTFSWLALLLS